MLDKLESSGQSTSRKELMGKLEDNIVKFQKELRSVREQIEKNGAAVVMSSIDAASGDGAGGSADGGRGRGRGRGRGSYRTSGRFFSAGRHTSGYISNSGFPAGGSSSSSSWNSGGGGGFTAAPFHYRGGASRGGGRMGRGRGLGGRLASMQYVRPETEAGSGAVAGTIGNGGGVGDGGDGATT